MYIGPLVLPAIMLILLIIYARRSVTGWEYVLVFATSVGSVVIGQAVGQHCGLAALESRTGIVEHAYHYHNYVEHITTTDKDGKETTIDIYHPDWWQVKDQHGNSVEIGSSHYNQLSSRWRASTPWGFGAPGSDAWGGMISYLKSNHDRPEVMTSTYTYQNRVRHSHSVFRYQDVSTKEAAAEGLFEYPEKFNDYESLHILSKAGSLPGQAVAESQLTNWLGHNAGRLQIHVLILVWRNAPYEKSILQERYWQGGNKNEFVVCCSVDAQNKVQWVHPFSWTKEELCKTLAKNRLAEQGVIDLPKYVVALEDVLGKHWVRREFAEFNYLSVELPWWAILLTYFIPVVATGFVCVWVIGNEHEPWGYGRRW